MSIQRWLTTAPVDYLPVSDGDSIAAPAFYKVGASALLGAVLILTTLQNGATLADEPTEGGYRSRPEVVEKIYGYIQVGQRDSVRAYFQSLKDAKTAARAWIDVQCDINNVRQDPCASARIGLDGVEYCLSVGEKRSAAILLHNIVAFFQPDFSRAPDSADLPVMLSAARRQVPLRRELGQDAPLMWALWDLGTAELAAGNVNEALAALEEGERMAVTLGDDNAGAWCRIMMGKGKVKYLPERRAEGERDIREAAKVIMERGEDWEREGVAQIKATVGLKD